MNCKNPWKVLGVPQGSSEEDIKRAFKEKALQHHPDRFTDPSDKVEHEEEFKRVNAAYQQITSGNAAFDFGNFGIKVPPRRRTAGVAGGDQLLDDLILIMARAFIHYMKK